MAEKKKIQGVNRRAFFNRTGKVTAALGAAAVAGPSINVLGANDVIHVGVIGPGKRGKYLMKMATDAVLRNESDIEVDMQFVAVADIYESWRDEGAMRGEQFNEGLENEGELATYDHHKKLLEDKNVDAVIIATPEHQHAFQLIDALNAGKDVYCEKPMVKNIEQGKKVLDVYKNHSKQIVQVGTQRRSVPLFKQAQSMVKNGDLGQVTYCEGWWHRNAPDGKPGPWAYEIPEDAGTDVINWPEFLYEAPKRDFDKQRYFQWRSFWDYSNGIGSDLMVHQVDAICMVMSVGTPKSVVASGGLYRWKDGRVTPDTWSCIMEFEEGFQINYNARFSNICQPNDRYVLNAEIDRLIDDKEKKSALKKAVRDLVRAKVIQDKIQDYGIRICGSRGQIEVFCHWDMNVWPEPRWLWGSDNKLKFQNYKYTGSQREAQDQAVRDHMLNWLQCMKTRKTPNCTVQEGFDGAVMSNMGTMSFTSGKKVIFDKKTLTAKTV